MVASRLVETRPGPWPEINRSNSAHDPCQIDAETIWTAVADECWRAEGIRAIGASRRPQLVVDGTAETDSIARFAVAAVAEREEIELAHLESEHGHVAIASESSALACPR